MLAVLEPVVGAKRAEERLLERVLGGLAAEPPAQEAEHHVAVLDVEELERGTVATASIISFKRGASRICESALVKVAVVGHVEWIEFLRVEAVPQPGEIVGTQETWEEPAGGGGVAAVELARLAGAVVALLPPRRRRARQARADGARGASVRVLSAKSDEPQRRGFVYIDEVGERTITVIGEKPRPKGGEGTLPWEELDDVDGVYFTAGDAEAVRQARRARVLVATARELPTLHAAGVELDALVASGEDDAERYQTGDLDPPPKLVVSTAGSLGGWAQPGGPYKPAVAPGPVRGRLRRRGLLRGRVDVRARQGNGDPGRADVRLGARRARADPSRRRPQGLSTHQPDVWRVGFEEAREPPALRGDRRERPLRQPIDMTDDEPVRLEPPDAADDAVVQDRAPADRPALRQRCTIGRLERSGCGRRARAPGCRTPAGSAPARASSGWPRRVRQVEELAAALVPERDELRP